MQDSVHNIMVTMDTAQDPFGCTVLDLVVMEMRLHCLTALTMATATT